MNFEQVVGPVSEELMHRRQEEYGYLDLEDIIDDDGDPEKQGELDFLTRWVAFFPLRVSKEYVEYFVFSLQNYIKKYLKKINFFVVEVEFCLFLVLCDSAVNSALG